jgi:purine-binding chemotaxis protein CheW
MKRELSPMSLAQQTPSEAACELVAFDVADQTFAVDVCSVREIRGWTPATPLPQSPDYMCGMVNLRGNMLPIIDLGARLGFGRTESSDRHAIVVAQIGNQLAGLLVEAVRELLTVPCSEIQPTPDIGDFGFKRLVRGVLPHQDRMITLLILESLVQEDPVDLAA